MDRSHILVVEDDPPSAQLLRAILEREGFDVRTAEDGRTACQVAGAEPFDLILLDLMLPDMTGWEVCATVRTLPDPQMSTTPIIMVTSRATEEDKLKGLRLGADDYLTKPYSIDEIIAKVKNVATRRMRERKRAVARARTTEEMRLMLFHELRNHLSAVSAFARRIETNADILPRDRVETYARFIRKSADYLGAFAEDLLLADKLEANRLERRIEEVLVRDVADGVVSEFGSLAEDRGISVRLEVAAPQVPVRINRSALQICLSNLLDNAIRYSPSGTVVTVRVGACEDGRAAVEVEDFGPGIPEAEADRVFEKFFRGELAERTTKGTGLGLHIVKTLAAAEGTAVQLDTALGRGCRFRIDFPCAEAG